MDVAPNGIAIVGENDLKYINSKGKAMLSENKVEESASAL